MRPLVSVEHTPDLAFIGHQLGIDPAAGELTRWLSWVAWFFAVMAWLAFARGDTWASPGAMLASAIAVTALGAGMTSWVAYARRALRVQQTRAFEHELAWANSQRIPVDGYLAWIVSPRPVFDVILETDGHEQRIVDTIRSFDARIITSSEPRRVRVEIQTIAFDRGIEGNRATIPDVDLMKTVVTLVVTPLVEELGIERIVMGSR